MLELVKGHVQPYQHRRGGIQCERGDCTTCTQEGEDLPDCTTRGIVYELICRKCNPGATRPGPFKMANKTVPSVYVGESSRSVYERAGEHWNAYRKRNSDSHIWKHHLVHHEGVGEPEMTFKVVGTFKSALSRQIFEAVRIRRRGTNVLIPGGITIVPRFIGLQLTRRKNIKSRGNSA